MNLLFWKMTFGNSKMNTLLILFSKGLYTLNNSSPGFLVLSQAALVKVFSTLFESVIMTRDKNCGENTQTIKKGSHRTTSQWHICLHLDSWPITFTLWQASHEVSRRQIQKKEKEVSFLYISGFLAVDMELCIYFMGFSRLS